MSETLNVIGQWTCQVLQETVKSAPLKNDTILCSGFAGVVKLSPMDWTVLETRHMFWMNSFSCFSQRVAAGSYVLFVNAMMWLFVRMVRKCHIRCEQTQRWLSTCDLITEAGQS